MEQPRSQGAVLRHPFATGLRGVLAAREPLRRDVGTAIPAAVLAALFEGSAGEPRVWLLRRPDALRSHAGQVALPGGKRDPTDRDPTATALREAEEEIGLPRASVELLGVGDDLPTVTGFHITPIVGWVGGQFVPRPNPAEVSRVFSAPLSLFRSGGLLEPIPIKSLHRLVQVYRVDGEIVWGATAAILRSLTIVAEACFDYTPVAASANHHDDASDASR